MAKRATLSLPGAKAHYSSTNIDTNFNAVNNNFDNYLNLGGVGESGNSMTGNLDLDGNFIVNAGTPSLSHHVATKAYVDSKLTLVSSGTSVTSIIEDADNDTGVDSEASADLDRIDIFAGTSGGADTGIQLIGDDSSSSALTNPYVKFLKHVFLDTGVRIGDAASADTYLELNRSGSANTIFGVAGGTTILTIDSTSVLVGGDIQLFDNAAAAAGKKIGDEDGDTYLQFNQATGGTDDDTIRFYCGGSSAMVLTASALTGLTSLQLDNFAVGIALPGQSEDNNIILTTGTANAASDMDDNTVAIYSTAVSGIKNDLRIDVKTGASSKETVILGNVSSVPGTLTVTGALTVSSTTASSSKDTGALIVEGGVGVEEDVYVGGQIVSTGALTVGGAAAITGTLGVTGAMLASTWPSFKVYLNADQTISSAAATKITWDTEEFDTNNNFASNKFTPTSPGKYLLTVGLNLTGLTDQELYYLRLYKNGSNYQSIYGSPSGTVLQLAMSLVVDANGSTDYFEIYIDSTADTSYIVDGDTGANLGSYFSGSRIA